MQLLLSQVQNLNGCSKSYEVLKDAGSESTFAALCMVIFIYARLLKCLIISLSVFSMIKENT